MARAANRSPRIGVALAGGGPLGVVYEIGALVALEEAIPQLRFTECVGYVGVSAGGFVAAGLANGIGPREQCRSFIENIGPRSDVLDPAVMTRPAWDEFARRLRQLPGALAGMALDALFGIGSRGRVINQLGHLLPIGMFSNRTVHEHLSRVFSSRGRTNDFRKLRRRLVIVAVDLDSGEAMPFGKPGHDKVPISLAVQASAALPGLFPPVEIDGRFYVDGALRKTMHASVLLDEGLDLLVCLNPLVPWDGRPQAHPDAPDARPRDTPPPRLVDRGLPAVMSQTFRSLIHSRMELGMRGYSHAYPGTDIVLVEPRASDATIFFHNPFSYSQRRWMAQHAYAETRRWLRSRRLAVGQTLARHGLALDDAVLDDPRRTLLDVRVPPRGRAQQALRQLEQTLDRLESAQDATPSR
ncbi:MAG: patatin-like phospholipase family protein [Burkholderiales bacterium]|nr:MAG: patatin-like phospholipase family protein [Burkholderiales bacterium]